MKVIDLLNRDRMPDTIKFENHIYKWKDLERDYYCEELNLYLCRVIGEDLFRNLDLEVEEVEMCHKCHKHLAEYNQTYCEFCLGISEEDKKIKKIDRTKPFTTFDVAEKVDEIVDIINEMREDK